MLDNNLDRGMKKWGGLMLPEHNVELRSWMDKEHYTERPELNEWDLQLIQGELEVACKRKCAVVIKIWKDGKFMTRGDIIVGIELQSSCVLLDDPFGISRIHVSDIVGVQCLD